MPEGKFKEKNLFYIRFISYSLAGTFGAVLTCPLEVIKTRYQSSQSAFAQGKTHLNFNSPVSNTTIDYSSIKTQRPSIIGSLR